MTSKNQLKVSMFNFAKVDVVGSIPIARSKFLSVVIAASTKRRGQGNPIAAIALSLCMT
jgi:hypothetical protein